MFYNSRYDFFIVSQSVREGTVTPTHYNVIYDTVCLRPNTVQRLTYQLCHMYYNWAVSIFWFWFPFRSIKCTVQDWTILNLWILWKFKFRESRCKMKKILSFTFFLPKGIIRVPAPCHYAHKLAYLVGQSIHEQPDSSLSTLLYYLWPTEEGLRRWWNYNL